MAERIELEGRRMTIAELLEACVTSGGAGPAAIAQAEKQLETSLPDDYKALLSTHDGAEGFIGPDSYLALWPVSELQELNTAFNRGFLSGVVLLGTDGADTGYGFRRVLGKVEYVRVPLTSLHPTDVVVVGDTLEALLRNPD